MNYEKTILVTGGAGFIGSHVVRLFVNKYPNYRIINLDKLTYAGNLENLKDIEDIPADYLTGLEFHYVETVMDVLGYALLDEQVDNPVTFVFKDNDTDNKTESK